MTYAVRSRDHRDDGVCCQVEATGPVRTLPPVDDDVNCNCVSVCTCYAYNDVDVKRGGVGGLNTTEFGGPGRARPAPPTGQCVPPNPH